MLHLKSEIKVLHTRFRSLTLKSEIKISQISPQTLCDRTMSYQNYN